MLEMAERGATEPVDIHKRDQHGWQALDTAALNGQDDMIKLLVKWNADPLAPGQYGWTPLHLAAKRGHLTTMRLLVDWAQNTKYKYH